MPHCIIEYSSDVSNGIAIDELVTATHDGVLSSGLFPAYDIKTRASGYDIHRTGDTQDSFVHVTIHLLDGRSEAQKIDLSEKVLASIEPMLHAVVSVGVEIMDMHRASYRKRVLRGHDPATRN